MGSSTWHRVRNLAFGLGNGNKFVDFRILWSMFRILWSNVAFVGSDPLVDVSDFRISEFEQMINNHRKINQDDWKIIRTNTIIIMAIFL